MREIKFRAWDKEENKLFDVYAIDWGADQVIVSCHSDKKKYYPNEEMGDKIVFMQFTGLKDKNGVEIYEGDILSTEKGSIPMIIKWAENKFFDADEYGTTITGFYMGREKNDRFYRAVTPLGNPYKEYQYKVIGNIYENPELLEV
jgi:uncharacterized phage protein (TIGR01671 family)